MFSIKVMHPIFSPEELRLVKRATDGGYALSAFMVQEGKHLVNDVKDNIRRLGEGGEWPALSPAYAKQKATGRTKGGARFGFPAMLQDSGETMKGIQAVVSGNTSSGLVLALSVPDVLMFHIVGAGNLPVRDPVTKHLRAFNAGFSQRLERFLTGQVST